MNEANVRLYREPASAPTAGNYLLGDGSFSFYPLRIAVYRVSVILRRYVSLHDSPTAPPRPSTDKKEAPFRTTYMYHAEADSLVLADAFTERMIHSRGNVALRVCA